MREKLNSLIYVLLRDSLTISDMERIVEEVESGVKPDSGILALVSDHIVERLCKASHLKCYDNMCNTQDDDVKLVEPDSVSLLFKNNAQIVDGGIPMCADCRSRYPESVVIGK